MLLRKAASILHIFEALVMLVSIGLVSLDLVPLCDHYSVLPVSFSDHGLVMFTLSDKVRKPRWNRSPWKMNSGLVNDEVFREKVEDLFRKFREDEPTMWGCAESFFKEDVQLTAIERSSMISYQKRQKEEELRSQLNVLLKEDSAKPDKFEKEIRDIRNQLETLDCERYRGPIMRS